MWDKLKEKLKIIEASADCPQCKNPQFQKWWGNVRNQHAAGNVGFTLNSSPHSDPHYDMHGLHESGWTPENSGIWHPNAPKSQAYHFESGFKADSHPTRIIDGWDTHPKTFGPVAPAGYTGPNNPKQWQGKAPNPQLPNWHKDVDQSAFKNFPNHAVPEIK